MNCIKLPGQSLMARDFERQVAALQVRIAVLNSYTAFGIPVTVAAQDKSVRGKGNCAQKPICATRRGAGEILKSCAVFGLSPASGQRPNASLVLESRQRSLHTSDCFLKERQ